MMTAQGNVVFALLPVLALTLTAKPPSNGVGVDHQHGLEMQTGIKGSDGNEAYLYCYKTFFNMLLENEANYRGMCHARGTLMLCKQKVKANWPNATVDDFVVFTFYADYERVAEFWCTHNSSDVPIPIWALYYEYYECPYVSSYFIVAPADYSPNLRVAMFRAKFAHAIIRAINTTGLNLWRRHHNYSDPADPVYRALSSVYCALHRHLEYRGMYVSIYCSMDEYFRDLHNQLLQHDQLLDGLCGWHVNTCLPEADDAMEKAMRICQLGAWLILQNNSSFDRCHPYNVAVGGATCFITHHAEIPPYTDLHLFVQGLCKPIEELKQCWNKVVQRCPSQSLNSDMFVLIKLQQLACDLSLHNSKALWNLFYKWSDSFKKVKNAQYILQMLSRSISPNPSDTPVNPEYEIPLPFASTLNATLASQPYIAPALWDLLLQLTSYLNKMSILRSGESTYGRLNILWRLGDVLPEDVLFLVSAALEAPVELFLTAGGFVQYDPRDIYETN